ncbi:ribokinase [Niabella drilacis]|uniref:Ribokinase n=1 Tax=Niabella drilacis (strain DSM 25811 / CCM 8410 / CCUG 62505 / LMG 26954 / E90) TaxID=1285928 RepID=A0A1G6ZKC0_NIADE|nr:ribokinase [Niabella drilacis]SDE03078.1 ribokinase [Niabella drilacis]
MPARKIAIVGSTNMDMVVKAERIPVPGETTLASQFFMNPGGKGANQAVTVARLGGDALFITKVGNDVFGRQASRLFDEEGIDSRFMLEDPELPSGVALITVDKEGENSIVVSQGANKALLPDDFTQPLLHELEQCKMVLMQFEIPMETVHFIARYAASKGLKVIINPAPVQELPGSLYPYIDILTPNKIEAGLLARVEIKDTETAKTAAGVLLARGIKKVIITLGAEGALIGDESGMTLIPALKVSPVDTTAAGDVFNGALVVALANDKPVADAIRFACRAAAISTTRQGAQASIPYYNEVIAGVMR